MYLRLASVEFDWNEECLAQIMREGRHGGPDSLNVGRNKAIPRMVIAKLLEYAKSHGRCRER
jgi:hypothetical protein